MGWIGTKPHQLHRTTGDFPHPGTTPGNLIGRFRSLGDLFLQSRRACIRQVNRRGKQHK
jgi:hypothetical protein